MNITERTYRLTGISPLLGSQPADKEIRKNYIASKHPNADAENELLPEENLGGVTVFLRDEGSVCLMAYVINGYLKEAIAAMGIENGVKMPASKVDKYVFNLNVCGQNHSGLEVLKLIRDGEPISAPDRTLERPLRAMTMQGPRIALSSSELVDLPWQIDVKITLLENAATKQSKALTWDVIEDALKYGRLRGIGQWRNGGYGRFTFERTDGR